MRKIKFLEAAKMEMWQASHYYAEQKLNLGEQFLASIEAGLKLIIENPNLGSKEKLNTKKCGTK